MTLFAPVFSYTLFILSYVFRCILLLFWNSAVCPQRSVSSYSLRRIQWLCVSVWGVKVQVVGGGYGLYYLYRRKWISGLDPRMHKAVRIQLMVMNNRRWWVSARMCPTITAICPHTAAEGGRQGLRDIIKDWWGTNARSDRLCRMLKRLCSGQTPSNDLTGLRIWDIHLKIHHLERVLVL